MTTQAPTQSPQMAAPPLEATVTERPNLMQTIVQRIAKNKLLFGLLIVFFFFMAVGQFYTKEDKTPAVRSAHSQSMEEPTTTTTTTTHTGRAVTAPVSGPDPEMAKQFVSWWISKSMDYNGASAAKSHAEAFSWMTPVAAQQFQQTFWNPDLAAGVTQGRITAAFQLSQVQAEARNPDGSIVVGIAGTMVAQESTSPNPMTQQIVCDFLVKKDKGNYRIAGLYNRTGTP